MNLKDIGLGTSNKIVKDECEDPCINGKKGKIYVDEEYWYVYILGTKNWNSAKQRKWSDAQRESMKSYLFKPLSAIQNDTKDSLKSSSLGNVA
jgi:hypothetical protein